MYKHRFDAVSFVFGVAFLALAAMFALPAEPWEIYFGLDLGWLLPAAVLVVGVALLAPIFRRTAVPAPPADSAPLDAAHEEALAELEEEVTGPGL